MYIKLYIYFLWFYVLCDKISALICLMKWRDVEWNSSSSSSSSQPVALLQHICPMRIASENDDLMKWWKKYHMQNKNPKIRLIVFLLVWSHIHIDSSTLYSYNWADNTIDSGTFLLIELYSLDGNIYQDC